MDWKKILSYGGFALAAIAFLLMSLGYLPETWAIMIMSVCGFGAGAGALRAFIDSTGLKTILLIIVAILCSVLMLFKVITPDVTLKAFGIIGTLLGVTITQATSKTKG